MDKGREGLIHQQFDELVQVHSGLTLAEDWPGQWVVRGNLSFSATYENTTIEDEFSILLSLPHDYPDSPPTVQETGCRIPWDLDHHVFPSTGTLCLGFPLGVRLRFHENPCLLHFLNALVVPFLFSLACRERYGRMPYGDLSHGALGYFQHYRELFEVTDLFPTLGLLKVLADNTIDDDIPCPCRSGSALGNCHAAQLRDLAHHQTPECFLSDTVYLLNDLSLDDIRLLPREVLPKGLSTTDKGDTDFKKQQKIG